jgi:hypothetical protein
MEVRLLNQTGTQVFREYLADLRGGVQNPIPSGLLDADEYTQEITETVIAESRGFSSRLEAAVYLSSILRSISDAVIEEPGLWSWLSVFYFDQVCPPGPEGTRQPGEDYRYILTTDYRSYYRHLLAGPFRIYHAQGERGRILLTNPLDKPGDINEQLASRQDMVASPGVMEAADLLYFSSADNAPKRGVAGKRPGNLRRFVTVVQQLDLTYDLYLMTGPEILRLLPSEFDRWWGSAASEAAPSTGTA